MNAKEMFEKLGYEYTPTNDYKLIYTKHNTFQEIIFYGNCNTFTKITFDDINECITYKELQAINKQVEELGWEISNIWKKKK